MGSLPACEFDSLAVRSGNSGLLSSSKAVNGERLSRFCSCGSEVSQMKSHYALGEAQGASLSVPGLPECKWKFLLRVGLKAIQANRIVLLEVHH